LEPDSEAAGRQFHALERVDAVISTDTFYRVLRPELLMEPEGALLAEWISGVNLSRLLLSFGQNSKRAASLLEQSAAWLRHCHDVQWKGLILLIRRRARQAHHA
jgi:hypothetical protein